MLFDGQTYDYLNTKDFNDRLLQMKNFMVSVDNVNMNVLL